ncbi:MAG: prepilin peptidase [Clostridium sp.]|uniref:prepilin peptidase n=1 Tax=Clostridium sp. TaxID=1506 RepID=UPI003F2C12BD
MNSILYIIIFIIGLVFGSFFNVCIDRIPREESIAFPPSHCTSCNRKLKPLELIPVFSYIALKGRCKGCLEKISLEYPIIEILTGIMFLTSYMRFGFSINTLKYIVLFSILLIASIIDIKTKEVYFKLSLTGFIFGILFLIIEIINGRELKDVVIAIMIPLVIVGIIYLLSRKIDGFGGGDLEIFLMISLYITPVNMGLSIFLSIIFGGFLAIILLCVGKREMQIPFVPFIFLGTFTAIFFGCELLNWYIKTL